jgi:hypothetical protein
MPTVFRRACFFKDLLLTDPMYRPSLQSIRSNNSINASSTPRAVVKLSIFSGINPRLSKDVSTQLKLWQGAIFVNTGFYSPLV